MNKCGGGSSNTNLGYKLILANNRDEVTQRLTREANFWPPQRFDTSKYEMNEDDDDDEYFVYGPLDLEQGFPPQVYSSWLGINSYGNTANLLFYMTNESKIERKSRGGIVASYMLTNSYEYETESFLEDLQSSKHHYKDFNLILLEMSKTNGTYSMFYINNKNDDTTLSSRYEKLNKDENESFLFSLSNSNPNESFRKVSAGKENI